MPPAGGDGGDRAARVLILCALAREARAVRRRLGAAAPAALEVLVTGMGQLAATRAAAAALEGAPVAGVVVTGSAGGCTDRLAPGEVLVASELVDPGGAPVGWVSGATAEAGRAAALRAPGAGPGRIASLPGVVDSAQRRAELAAAGTLAVETESLGVAGICQERGVPLVVVRGILDTPSSPLGAAAALVAAGATGPSAARVARALLRPAAWSSLLRAATVARRSESAAARAAVAAAVAMLEAA